MHNYTITLFILFTFASTMSAQTPAPDVILYDSLNGQVIRTAGDGTGIDTLTLPKADGSTYAQTLAISPDGQTYSYVTYGDPATLHILRGDSEVRVALPADTSANSLDFIASPAVYSIDGDVLAFGYARSSGDWQVQLLNTVDGTVTAAINQSTAIPNTTPLEAVGRAPIVQRIDNNGRVIFALAVPFSGFQTNFEDLYAWDAAANTVTSFGVPAAIDGDTLNNEQLTLLFDPAYPNTADAFPYPQANTLYLTTVDGTRRLLFITANVSMFWARFVNGGQSILVGSFSPENRIAWVLLNRDGTVLGDFPPLQMTGVTGNRDGFAYTVDAGVNSGSILYHVAVTESGAGEPVELWNGPEGVSYRVVWAR